MGIRLKLLANRRVPYHQHQVTGDGIQKFVSFDICFYQRAAHQERHGWFSTSSGGGATWDGGRLSIAFHGAAPDAFVQEDLALNLTFDEQKGFWTGSYSRGGVSKPVRLVRPGASQKGHSSPFMGAWSASGRLGPSPPAPRTPTCIYIAQGLDGAFVAWRNGNFGPVIDPREGFDVASFKETDGDALGVQIDGDTLTLQEGIDWAAVSGKGPEKFTGKLSPDGTQIIGSWVTHAPESWGGSSSPQEPKPSSTVPVTTFTRMTMGQSCGSQPPSR